MDKFSDKEIELYTFLKGLQGLPIFKKVKILEELKRRVEVLS
jgi:hypothetical protein